MKLNAKVLDTHTASQYTDNSRRVTLRVEEADCMNTRLTVRSDELREGEELVILVLTKGQAAEIVNEYDCTDLSSRSDVPTLTSLADQLRPDALPPWEQAEKPPYPTCPLCEGTGLSERDEGRDGPYCHVCHGTGEDPRPPQPDTNDTQEFRLGGTV